ncbi:MAG TPA: ABC transporter permease [Anaerolineae bacterium]|nr:ABC transporter permease [Anaerolineae bacterium]
MQTTLALPRKRLSRQNWIWLIAGAALVLAIGLAYAGNPTTTVAVLAATLRQSVPIVLGALCGIFCERSGIINIGIEGMMLLAAFMGFLGNVYTGSLAAAVLIALLTGALLGAAHAFMSITLKVDQIISGTVINIIALGITGYFYTTGLTTLGKFQPIAVPVLKDIPIIGPVLFNNPPITYATLILVIVAHYVLYYTRWGLRTRAVGEHPRAADTVGIHVNRMRYWNVMIGGMLAALAGAFLTLEAVGSFERGMTNGRGFVALAVMIFGKWTPFGALGGALLFGLATALNTQLQFLGLADLIPHQFVGMLPYLLTIIVLAGFVGRARPPAAEGKVYEKE